MRIIWMVLVLAMLSGCVVADDIVSMPTANQLKRGEVDLAGYHMSLDNPPVGLPQSAEYQTLYIGLTDWLEIDAHHVALDNNKESTVLVASVKVLSETNALPDVVVGCRNLGGTATLETAWWTTPELIDKTKDRSYFLSTAKTFFCNPLKPGPPLFRVHLSVGTPDWTLMGDRRHDGVFGGLQMLFSPTMGAVAQFDGENIITGITFMPKNTGLTLKGGSFGPHLWFGLAFRKQLSF